LPASLILIREASVAFTVVKAHDSAALSDISLNLLLSLIQYIALSVLTAIPEGKLVGKVIKAG
jgi:hypothetical protein